MISLANYDMLKPFILMISFFIWTPQIIHNIIYNNRYIYPFFYILVNTFEKFFYSYFMINLYGDTPHIYEIILLIIYVLLTIIILYLQAFLEPRFIFCSFFKKKDYKLYKTKNELLNEKPEAKNEECIICLSPFFVDEEKENDKKNENNNDNILESKITKEIKKQHFNSSINILNITSGNISTTQKDEIKNNLKINNKEKKENQLSLKNTKKELKIFKLNNCFYFGKNIGNIIKTILKENFFDFYISKPKYHKFYMLLPCGHFFHSICLEDWFNTKKTCPQCRQSMNQYI